MTRNDALIAALRSEVAASSPFQKLRDPQRRYEIAGAAVYLASPASTFMTGQTMIVDGGSTIGVGL